MAVIEGRGPCLDHRVGGAMRRPDRAGLVRAHLDLTPITTKHRHVGNVEDLRGTGMDVEEAAMKDPLQHGRRVERVQKPGEAVDRGAQAQHRFQLDQVAQDRRERLERHIGHALRLDLTGGIGEVAGDRQAETRKDVTRIDPAGRMPFGPVQHDARAGLDQRDERQDEPRQLNPFARIAGPVQVDLREFFGTLECRPRSGNEPRDLFRRLFLEPEEHEIGPDLLWQRLAPQDHRHRIARFLIGEGSLLGLATREDRDIGRERVRVVGGEGALDVHVSIIRCVAAGV